MKYTRTSLPCQLLALLIGGAVVFNAPSEDRNPQVSRFGETEQIAPSMDGANGIKRGLAPVASQTGRFVAFESVANNLVPGDEFFDRDIYLRNRDVDGNDSFDLAGNVETIRVSQSWNAIEEPDGESFAPAISSDGNWIAFESLATNLLIPGTDTNGKRDIFVRHRAGGPTIRISNGYGTDQSNGHSYAPSISQSGRYIAFHSDATNLLAPGADTNGKLDVFLYDRDTDNDGAFDVAGFTSMTRVSVSTSGQQGNGHSYDASISADGRTIAFTSDANNFESPNNSVSDVFVRDTDAATTTKISLNSAGQAGNGNSGAATIYYDGRFIAFQSDASNLVWPDTGGYSDIFLRDRGPQLLGDLDGNHVVNTRDRDILIQNYGTPQPCSAADLDRDGDVDGTDLAILLTNCGDCPP
jgi:Tol biopolymer transport system component